MVEGEVGRDAEEPGDRLLVTADVVVALPGADKRLLAEIVCRLLVPRQAIEVAEDGALVLAKERLEAGEVARS